VSVRRRFARKGEAPLRCSVCGLDVDHFDPLRQLYESECTLHGFPYSFRDSETLNVDAYGCPRCGSSDRERLFALFFEQAFAATRPEIAVRLLDIAPVPWLMQFLRSFDRVREAGFEVAILDVGLFGAPTFRRLGIDLRSALYLVGRSPMAARSSLSRRMARTFQSARGTEARR
jgi:hypothetical protein